MTVVFKVGGSLLSLPDLPKRVEQALSQRSDDFCLIVCGGGESADIVRVWDRTHQLDDETSHQLALSSLDLNRHLLEFLLQLPSVSSRNEAVTRWHCQKSPLLLNLKQFLTVEEKSISNHLPHNWDVTSDSLSAWTALRWPAMELVLLKSLPIPAGLTPDEASRDGLVDEFFPKIAGKLNKVSWCNVRASQVVIVPWVSKTGDFSAGEDSENQVDINDCA